MIHILLLILKIVGILIAVIIGLVVLALGTVLFVPIRYRIRGSRYDSLEAAVKVYWLFHALSIKVVYPWGEGKDVGIVIRILGKRIYDNLRNENQSSEHNKNKKGMKTQKASRKVPQKPGTPEDTGQRPVPAPDQIPKPKEMPRPALAPAAEAPLKIPAVAESAPRSHVQEDRPQKPGLVKRIKEKLYAIKNQFQSRLERIKNKISSLCKKNDRLLKKLAGIREKKDAVMAILFDSKNRPAFAALKKELFRILRHLKPVRLSGKVYFGFEDPASTGYVLGALSLLYPVYEDHIALYPDFEEKKAQGELYVAGRLRIAVFAGVALRLVFNKDIRRIIQSFKHI